jgi:hypothetical protein
MGDRLFIFIIIGITIVGFTPISFAANANLFVSAENSQFDNYFSGPQVIEVVVIDSDINDVHEEKGEPDVTVNGKILRMTQTIDGNWYGYFADRNMALTADRTTTKDGVGMDFGYFCANNDTIEGSQKSTIVDFTDTVGFTVNSDFFGMDSDEFTGNVIPSSSCGPIAGTQMVPTTDINNVVRETKNINIHSAALDDGQIGMGANVWPVIQLYPLNPTGNVVIQYNKGGSAQLITLTFDAVDPFIRLELDRTSYPNGADVFATITDPWLNIDPTDEDSWTFGTVQELTTNYLVFDEWGTPIGDFPSNTDSDLTKKLSDLMCQDNCRLSINTDVQNKGNVITLQDHESSEITPTNPLHEGDPQNPLAWETVNGHLSGKFPVTLIEYGPNSGVFATRDYFYDNSNIVITDSAKIGSSALIEYNEIPLFFSVGSFSGDIEIQLLDDEWGSGEEIPIRLFDPDANKNSKSDEDLDLYKPEVLSIPSITTGDPFSLSENNEQHGAMLNGSYGITSTKNDHTSFSPDSPAKVNVDQFSKRGIITSSSTTIANSIIIDLQATAGDLQESINDPKSNFRGFNFYNQDLRSITSDTVDVSVLYGDIDPFTDTIGPGNGAQTNSILIGNNLESQSLIQLSETVENSLNSIPSNKNLALLLEFDKTEVGYKEPIVTDFFSFGILNDGLLSSERISNQIIRLELEETGDNTNIFEGSLEYFLVNQFNIFDPFFYEHMNTVADDPRFILLEGHIEMNSPRIDYLDRDSSGGQRQISDRLNAPTHSGKISLEKDKYETGDVVEFTIIDKDLSLESDLIDIYTSVDPSKNPTDPARDSIGRKNLGLYESAPFGAFGRMLDIRFDGERWTSGIFENGGNCGIAGTPDDGAFASGFLMIETGVDSGIFTGDFKIPNTYCQLSSGEIHSVNGTTMSLNYLDFRDNFNKINEFSKGALISSSLTKSLPAINITYPLNNSEFLVEETITLQAIATDLVDGDITDLVQWTSYQVDGLIGTGSPVPIGTGSPIQVGDFAPGRHIITSTISNSKGISNSDSIQIRVLQKWDDINGPVFPGLNFNSSNTGDNQWDTRPTFGTSHETRNIQIVENGFRFNSNYFMIKDNHHTTFDEQSIETGIENTFSATVYASKGLKIQEFLFGIPNVGESHLAELGIEIWYDYDGKIEDVKVVQRSEVVDIDSVSINHEKSRCKPTDKELKCDTTTMSVKFLEPLKDKVMAIKAIDFKNRDQRTYLNEGFDVSGSSLHPLPSKTIPSSIKNEGLIKVIQTEKYSPIWKSEDGRTFVMNNFGSFIEINNTFERFQDSGNPYTRLHSEFDKVVQYEQKRAANIFNSKDLISHLPESFTYLYPETHERITPELETKLAQQEEIAKNILKNSTIQARW